MGDKYCAEQNFPFLTSFLVFSVEDTKRLFEIKARIIEPQSRVQGCNLSQLVNGHREIIYFQVLLQPGDIV